MPINPPPPASIRTRGALRGFHNISTPQPKSRGFKLARVFEQHRGRLGIFDIDNLNHDFYSVFVFTNEFGFLSLHAVLPKKSVIPPRRCAATLPLQGRVTSLRRLNPLLLPARAAPLRHRLQERPGIAALLPHDLLRRPRGHDLAAAVARARIKSGPCFRAEVDDPVGGSVNLLRSVSTRILVQISRLRRYRRVAALASRFPVCAHRRATSSATNFRRCT